MKHTLIIMALFATSTAAFAVDSPPQGQGKGPEFDKRKAEVVSRITDRIARNQEELSCVQAAKNHADLKACREKFREEVKEQHEHNRDMHK